MRSAPKFRWTFFLAIFFLFLNTSFILANDEGDEDTPEVTTRVARISFINGSAQVKRAGNEDWETASLNLPLVEGDEITVEKGSVADIQFDSQTVLHLKANSYLKIVTLRDEGIALSISEGTLSLRIFSFDKDKTFFEIDAPQTTVSIQKAGSYRIDAGEKESDQIRITSAEGGEARVYSDDSDFTVRDGKSTKIFINGDRTGDRETLNAKQYLDEWDEWVAGRDAAIAALLKNAFYDKYYDRDIYGAEDLNNYGQWIETDDYGWVWRPNQSSISSYQDWTPYRYGHWSWVSPYGWTWINDEPWGWATYHYGRWVYADNYWAWTPYPYNRPKRSWWKPALVVIANINNDICWYPLPYHKRYQDYNRDYRGKYVDKRTIINNTAIIHSQPDWTRRRDGRVFNHRNFNKLPSNSVVAVRNERFGRRGNDSRLLPSQIAGQILAKNPDEIKDSPKLPNFRERREDFKKFERTAQTTSNVKTGVINRQSGDELDKQLENRRNRDRKSRENPPNRQTNIKADGQTKINADGQSGVQNIEDSENHERRNERRNQGGEQNQVQPNPAEKIYRPRPKSDETEIQPTTSPEKSNENRQRRNSDEEKNTRRGDNSNENSRRERGNSSENRKVEQTPRQSDEQQARPQPSRREQRQERQPSEEEQPKTESRRDQPRQEQPKQEQPKREQPRSEEKRSDPPKQEQPKEKPVAPSRMQTKNEDQQEVKDQKNNRID